MIKEDSNMSNKLPEIELKYSTSKESVWENIVSSISDHVFIKPYQPITRTLLFKFAVAASLLLFVSVTSFMRFYTTSVNAPAGQHLAYLLPDNSKVELNAQSKISFHPYWFKTIRTLNLQGEAYFEVQKGSQFKVVSKLGETTVVGTSFNIFARNAEYAVTCFTGKVSVFSNKSNESILISPNEKAYLANDGNVLLASEPDLNGAKSWRENMFVFTGSSIVAVCQEIERQYNIKIQVKANPALTYTGNFSRSLSGKEVLNLVCTSLGIKFDAKSDTEFLVK